MEYFINIIFENGKLTSIYCPDGEEQRDRIYRSLEKNSHSVHILHEQQFFIDMSKVIFVSKHNENVEKKKGWFS